jgi:L-serine dehydratase
MAYASFADLLAAAHAAGSLGEAVVALEVEESGVSREEVLGRLEDSLSVMEEAVARGLAGDARSRSGMTGGDAKRVAERGPGLAGETFAEAVAGALAVAEVNAAMGRIVAAPTGGASGVLPGVLLAAASRLAAPREDVVLALAAAGGIGAVIAAKATLSGAAGGCQAEVGSAGAMAAAAAVELAGGTPEQAGHAASIALQGQMGLVCDPIGGLVEVPCVARNATGAAVALAACEMALSGVTFPVPLDEVVAAMGSVGRSLPPTLRETALGGLATTPTGKRLASERPGPAVT